MADRDDVKRILRLEAELRSGRSGWLQHWEDLAEVQLPRVLGFTTTQREGERRTDGIYDGTPMQAARGLANAVGGMARPDGEQWIFMEVEGGTDDEGHEWIGVVEQILIKKMLAPNARLRQATGEGDLSLVVLGSADMFVAEQRAKPGELHFQSIPINDAVVMRSDGGELTGHLMRRRFTIRQAIQRFGLRNLSPRTQERVRGPDGVVDAEAKIDLVHAVLPRPGGVEGALFAADLPLADLWMERAEEHLIASSGHDEMPYIAPRWDTSAGEDYGRSPGMIALPDSATLQAIGETILMAGQRAADPPLAVPADGVFSEYNTFPGGLVFYDLASAQAVRGNPIFPIDNNANIPLTREMQMDVREQIWAAFLRNILRLPVAGPQMTATEIIERKQEFLREIGPVFGHYESDNTAKFTERSFSLLLRRPGVFPPIPESLMGRNIEFRYASPVKKIRQQIEFAAAQAWVAERIEIGKIDPSAMDAVNLDEYADFGAEANNVPHKIVTSQEVRDAKRAARAEAQRVQAEQEAQALQIQQATEAAKVPAVDRMLEQAQADGAEQGAAEGPPA